jgi:hypothetical protein
VVCPPFDGFLILHHGMEDNLKKAREQKRAEWLITLQIANVSQKSELPE